MRLPRLSPRWLAQWVLPAVLAGALTAAAVDPASLPWLGRERISAVLLLDGQAYFGHLADRPWSDTLELRDVYYLQDSRNSSTGLPLGLVRRGQEVHRPVDGMIIRRDKVLAIESVGAGSPVFAAITAERALVGSGR